MVKKHPRYPFKTHTRINSKGVAEANPADEYGAVSQGGKAKTNE